MEIAFGISADRMAIDRLRTHQTKKKGSTKNEEREKERKRWKSVAVPVVRPRLLLLRLKCVFILFYFRLFGEIRRLKCHLTSSHIALESFICFSSPQIFAIVVTLTMSFDFLYVEFVSNSILAVPRPLGKCVNRKCATDEKKVWCFSRKKSKNEGKKKCHIFHPVKSISIIGCSNITDFRAMRRFSDVFAIGWKKKWNVIWQLFEYTTQKCIKYARTLTASHALYGTHKRRKTLSCWWNICNRDSCNTLNDESNTDSPKIDIAWRLWQNVPMSSSSQLQNKKNKFK